MSVLFCSQGVLEKRPMILLLYIFSLVTLQHGWPIAQLDRRAIWKSHFLGDHLPGSKRQIGCGSLCSPQCAPICHRSCCTNPYGTYQGPYRAYYMSAAPAPAVRCNSLCSPLCAPACTPNCCAATSMIPLTLVDASASAPVPAPAPAPFPVYPSGCPAQCAVTCDSTCSPACCAAVAPQASPAAVSTLPGEWPSKIRITVYPCGKDCPEYCAPECSQQCCSVGAGANIQAAAPQLSPPMPTAPVAYTNPQSACTPSGSVICPQGQAQPAPPPAPQCPQDCKSYWDNMLAASACPQVCQDSYCCSNPATTNLAPQCSPTCAPNYAQTCCSSASAAAAAAVPAVASPPLAVAPPPPVPPPVSWPVPTQSDGGCSVECAPLYANDCCKVRLSPPKPLLPQKPCSEEDCSVSNRSECCLKHNEHNDDDHSSKPTSMLHSDQETCATGCSPNPKDECCQDRRR